MSGRNSLRAAVEKGRPSCEPASMEYSPTIAAARGFLHLVLEGDPPTDAALARALDELAMAYHDAPDGEPADDDVKPPGRDYQQLVGQLGSRFPDHGFYSCANPFDVLDQEYMLADAIDDLADIVSDLEEAVWRFECLGADDAHWHFKLLYQIHWGSHLRGLSFYLHAKIAPDLAASWLPAEPSS